ncbi:uncharacterized protein LOC116351307, partial [Contarinia nasturtii]|uniref:uncharacterized protein LOC116351307 n=1 Tax=Contarinia nasturtii TaxID=265458 RepID=UPI0012D46AFD
MNNKQNSIGGVKSMNRDSTSPPPSTLCFSTHRKSNNVIATDKKYHGNHHQYDKPYQNIGLCGCRRTSKSRCVSAIGVLILLLTYTTMGSILFMTLEGEEDMGKTVETAVAASKPRTDLVNADIRS